MAESNRRSSHALWPFSGELLASVGDAASQQQSQQQSSLGVSLRPQPSTLDRPPYPIRQSTYTRTHRQPVKWPRRSRSRSWRRPRLRPGLQPYQVRPSCRYDTPSMLLHSITLTRPPNPCKMQTRCHSHHHHRQPRKQHQPPSPPPSPPPPSPRYVFHYHTHTRPAPSSPPTHQHPHPCLPRETATPSSPCRAPTARRRFPWRLSRRGCWSDRFWRELWGLCRPRRRRRWRRRGKKKKEACPWRCRSRRRRPRGWRW